MDTFSRRLAKRKALVGVATLAVVAGLVGIAWWWSIRLHPPTEPIALAERDSVPAVPPSTEFEVASEASAGTGLDTPAASMASPAAERVEVCGLDWVEANADGSVDESTLTEMAVLAASRQRLLAVVEASGELGRSAALLIRSIDLRRKGVALLLPACPDPACEATAQQALEQSIELTQELASLAMTTTDPRVYALAVKTCGTSRPGSCALLNTAQWARLDADNAEPWLYVLEEAGQRKDRALMEEALHRLGTAVRFEARPSLIDALVAERAGPADIDQLAAFVIGVEVAGVNAAQSLPLIGFMNVCNSASLKDANRRQECDAAASVLTERSDSLLIASLGAGIGRRLGWPAERIAAIKGLAAAASESLPFDPSVVNPYACVNMKLLLLRVVHQAQVGEVQAARDWIAAKGWTIDEYVRLREAQRQRSETAAPHVVAAGSAPASALAGATLEAASAPSPYSSAPPPAR